MKKLHCLAFILGVLLFASCGNSKKDEVNTNLIDNPNSASGNTNSKLPVIEFEKDIHDFGRVIEGEKLTYSFKFKNTGKSDLIIASADASCGCTVPSFPNKPIAPGKEDFITVTFNSQGKPGFNNKSISIVTNCQPNVTTLYIKAQVEKPIRD